MIFWDIFLNFLRKQYLTFHTNCLHWRQFAWNAKVFFLGKIRSWLLNFAQRVINVKISMFVIYQADCCLLLMVKIGPTCTTEMKEMFLKNNGRYQRHRNSLPYLLKLWLLTQYDLNNVDWSIKLQIRYCIWTDRPEQTLQTQIGFCIFWGIWLGSTLFSTHQKVLGTRSDSKIGLVELLGHVWKEVKV